MHVLIITQNVYCSVDISGPEVNPNSAGIDRGIQMNQKEITIKHL